MKNAAIYITGARGCVGSRLIQRIPEVVVIESDILTANIQSVIAPESIVIHLAAKSNIKESHEKAEEYQKVNVEGTRRVADACLATNSALLFPSTVHVYGCPGPYIREGGTIAAHSPYGATKIAAEQYLASLKSQGLRYSILRMPGIFGYSPAIHFDTALHQFILQAYTDTPLTLWRETWQAKRPHLYIEDCLDAIQFFIEHAIFNGEIYNLITDNFTVQETVATIKEFLPALQTTFIDAPSMNSALDIDDAKIRSCGFIPTGTLRKGIAEVVTYLNNIRT